MRFLSWRDGKAQGELDNRITLLCSRLSEPAYRPPEVFSKEAENGGWPGDWEGRTLLALVLLSEVTGKVPDHLHAITAELPRHYNDRGYLGAVLPQGVFDEQQLSGHSWLLRGLCAYFDRTGDEAVLSQIVTIIKNLYLPAREAFAAYPLREAADGDGGAYAGTIAKETGAWRLSTDVGCAFISLDGLSCAYTCLRTHGAAPSVRDDLRALLSVMVRCFGALQPEAAGMQTHATLTATRGVIRLYEETGDPALLDLARRVFDLYRRTGMTADFCNYNWFLRPAWTEPCGVIDSFIIACRLYGHTGDAPYAEYANLILYNGIYASQRANGGFGTDSCCGAAGAADSHLLRISAYEAYWCCTMRGGEGLAEALRYSIMASPDHLTMLYPMDGVFRCGDLTLQVRTEYPCGKRTEIVVRENRSAAPVRLRVYVPEGVIFEGNAAIRGRYAEFEITKETKTIAFSMSGKLGYMTPEGDHNRRDKALLMQGVLILCTLESGEKPDPGTLVSEGRAVYRQGARVFFPASERMYREEGKKDTVLQILF